MRPIKKSLALVFFPFCVCVCVGGGGARAPGGQM